MITDNFTFKEIILPKDSSYNFLSSKGNSIIYIRNGNTLINFNTSNYNVAGHNYFLLRNSESLSIHNTNSNECVIFILNFHPEVIDKLNSFSNSSITSCFESKSLQKHRHISSESENSLRLRSLLMTLKLEISQDRYASDIYQLNALSMLLVILNRLIQENSIPLKKKCKKGLRLDDVFNYINRNFTEEISLDKLSEDLFFSKYHILHEFKKKTGMSVYKYIIKRKLEHSKTLIENGLPITEVYQNCGFGDYSNFLRSFKKEYGCTPKQYYNKVTTKNYHQLLNL